MKQILSRRRRLLKWIGIILAVLIIILYIGFPLGGGIAVILPRGGGDGLPPEGFTDLTLTTDDGISLAAWYAPPQNGAAIILIHGAGRGRDSVRAYATMLHENGFGVLALNLRGYGESSGQINRVGWNGTRDAGAAVEYLLSRDDVDSIGGLGISLGGEVLLGAASTYPALRAIAADGATFRSVDEYTALPANESLLRNFTMRIWTFFVGLLTGDERPLPLLESIQNSGDTVFLFIAAGQDEQEVAFNEVFDQAVGPRGDLWIIADVGHTGGFGRHPEAYEQQVVEFFTAALLDETE